MKLRIAPTILYSLTLMTGLTQAAIITVNTADNTDFSAGKTNLVYALTNINDGDTIAFNIPGTGPHYLETPPNGFPLLVKDNVTIDGYTQPGASPNTNPNTMSNNAVIKIVLDSRNGNYRDMEYTLFTPFNSSPPIDNTSMANERGGYGGGERATLGIYRATNANIRGLAFLGTFEPDAYGIAVAHDYGLDTAVKDRLAYDAGSSRNCHINGCWIGIDPGNPTVGGLAQFQNGITFYRHRDASGAPRPELPSESLLIGVKAGSANPRAEFNVIAYMVYAVAGEGIRTRFSGNFLGVMPDGVTPTGRPAGVPTPPTGAGFENGRYDDSEPIILGTDGDGVNDADEGNLFGPLTDLGTGLYPEVFDLYSTANKLYVIAGNRFGIAVDGTRWTNSCIIYDNIASTTKVQFGSDFDGVSDDLEANVVYNMYPFDEMFPTPTVASPPAFFFNAVGNMQAGGRLSMRGNVLVNNNLVPHSFADGAGTRLANYANFMGAYLRRDMGYEFPNFVGNTNPIPVINAATTVKKLIGTCPLGVGDYTNIIIDVYHADREGWENGKKFQFQELFDGVSEYLGFAQGREYLGSFVDNGPRDSNPVAGEFEFDISSANADPGELLTITANYSADPPGTRWGRVHTSNFATPITPAPAPLEPQMTITRSGANLVIAWDAAAGSFILQTRAALNTGAWADVIPQPAIVQVGDLNQMTLPLGGGNAYFQLVRR